MPDDIDEENGDRNEAAKRRPPVRPDMIGANTHQMVFEMQGTLGALDAQVQRLIEDRREDRQAFRETMREFKDDLRRDIDGVKTELKEFRKDGFEPLRTDVSNLRLSWAKVSGVAAVIGAILGIVGEIVVDLVKHGVPHH